MEPYIEEIKLVIRNPEIITVEDNSVFHLLRMGAVTSRPNLYLKVVIIYSDEITGKRIGNVRTVFNTHRLPRGERILWT